MKTMIERRLRNHLNGRRLRALTIVDVLGREALAVSSYGGHVAHAAAHLDCGVVGHVSELNYPDHRGGGVRREGVRRIVGVEDA